MVDFGVQAPGAQIASPSQNLQGQQPQGLGPRSMAGQGAEGMRSAPALNSQHFVPSGVPGMPASWMSQHLAQQLHQHHVAAQPQQLNTSAPQPVEPPAPQEGQEEVLPAPPASEPRREGVPQEVIDSDCKKMSFAQAMADEMARSIKESMNLVNCEEGKQAEGESNEPSSEPTGIPETETDMGAVECSGPSPKEKGCCGCVAKAVFIPGLQMDAEEDRLCEICQCGYEEEEEVLVLPCNHFFHSECVSRWLSMRTTCPKCRYEVSPTPEEEEQQVIVTRTTTIEWMPVTHWVPASTTTVEVRHEVGSDMETVTTTTTRPVLPFNAAAGPAPPPFAPPHPHHHVPSGAVPSASPPRVQPQTVASPPQSQQPLQPPQPPLPQLLSDVQAQEMHAAQQQQQAQRMGGSPHVRPNGSPRMVAMPTPPAHGVFHRRSGSWNGLSPGFSAPQGPVSSMMISSQGASSPQLQPLTTNGLLPPTPPLMPGGPATMVPAMEMSATSPRRYPEPGNQRVMAM